MPKHPSDWAVTVATDDARILHLSINAATGQLYLAVSDSGRPPQHVATCNRKTHSLANLTDALVEAGERFNDLDDADDGAQS